MPTKATKPKKLELTGGGFFAPAKGARYVLYFYPRDNTPGCTQEGADFASAHAKFRKLGVEIFGASGDTLASHEKFKAKMGFPFELVSDPDQTLAKKFDVIKMKSLYGRKFLGIERSTFVVSGTGKIEKEWRKVKVPGHVAEVLAYLKENP